MAKLILVNAVLYFRKIAASKFQPTYARQAYPCFDEPGFKSTFKVRLVRPRDGYIALSNMDHVVSACDH
jgi:aminopeptidase N